MIDLAKVQKMLEDARALNKLLDELQAQVTDILDRIAQIEKDWSRTKE